MDSQNHEANISLVTIESSNTSLAITELNNSIEQDFSDSRENIRYLIETGMETLQSLSRLAVESEHPNVYKALSEMINTMSNNSKLLIDIDLQYKKHLIENKPKDETPKGDVNIQNAMFVGSTADLLKQLRGESTDV